MRPRTTLILIGVFAALLGLVYWLERRPEPAPALPEAPAPLWSLAASQVTALRVQAGEQDTALARSGDGWAFEGPTAGPADGARIERVVEDLSVLSPQRTFTDTTSLAEFGLEQPTLTVTLRASDGATRVLLVGSTNPQQTGYYARVQDGSSVHLLPGYVVEAVRALLENPPVPPTPLPTETATPGA
ncbi:MAG: DUF4340 domain-containing protein [Anaerolineae bacterium]